MTSLTASPATTSATPPEQQHAAFEWLRSEAIDSLSLVVEEYRHKKTGAMHYHLAADNSENVFLVALRTVPMDSKGVAHILEHTALCGSQNYPVRDPFFMMIRRSLNTFMNAFTSSDWTAYPFASQNRKDFNNLMDVYLDAVFFSRLHELDFAQEGHRLEFEKADDPESNLLFKGVVFNEMKGAMSSAVSTLWQSLTSHLFPTSTYHYNSGGEPACIPDLSYEDLIAFYKTHYHPSNAVFMTFGDIPAFEHQQKFEDKVLNQFDALGHEIKVDDEQRFQTPKSVDDVYALDEGDAEHKTHIVMGWLLGKSASLESLLEAHLLSSVLLDNSASPLRKALETSNLGTAPSPLCGLEDSNREMSFMCGLEGTDTEHKAALETLVMDVLNDVAENGVPQDAVEAVLHQLELSQREIGGDGYPFGLQLILGALSAAIHRGDPVAVMNLDPVLEKLRGDIQDPNFIKNLVKQHLLDNPHRVCLTMKPDTSLSKRKDEAEAERLAAIKAALSSDEKANIVAQAAALEARQNEQDDESILPKVGLSDVPLDCPIPIGKSIQLDNIKAVSFEQGTNGIVYQQVVIELPELDDDLIDVLPFYTSCLTELGCGDKDYLQTQAWQSQVSGGISAYTTVRGGIENVQKIKGHFVLSAKALGRNHRAVNELMQQTLEHTRFDEHARIRELMAQKRARREQSITGNGHALAMSAASCGMSPTAALNHRLSGLAGIQFIKMLDDGLDDAENIAALADKFAQIHQKILAAPREFLIICEADKQAAMQTDLQQIWPLKNDVKIQNHFNLPAINQQVKQAWLTSTQVNFCAKSYPTVAVEHTDAAPLMVLGGFLRNGFLHRVIREQGGAYGGGASHEPANACFRFYSYRDPRLAETLEDFDRAIEWLLTETHNEQQLEEAILGVISSIDKPGSPAGEAKQAYHNELYGRTAKQRRDFRQRILKVQLDDLKRVAETYLQAEKASVAVVTHAAMEDEVKGLGMEIYQL